MRRARIHAFAIVFCVLFVGCSSGSGSPDDANANPNLIVTGDEVVFRTDPFTLAPGEERFLCFAVDVNDALAIAGYDYRARPAVHHMLFSRARTPEPLGYSECDVLYRASWEPLFIAGAGASELRFPEGAAHHLAAGAQVVVQLHLLNVLPEEVTDFAEIVMRRAASEGTTPVGAYVFGTTKIDLPPGEESAVEASCELAEDVELFAAFPHMHLLGTSMTFAHGPSADELTEVFARDPYDFEDQSLEPLPLTLRRGEQAKVTCRYRNTFDHPVTFGESTTTEMCFFVGFAVGVSAIGGCFPEEESEEVPPDPAAGLCEDYSGNSIGVGAPCTRGGMECTGQTSCTADLSAEVGLDGRCIIIGCESHDDCGGNFATCCTPAQIGGGIRICTAEACRRSDCIPAPN